MNFIKTTKVGVIIFSLLYLIGIILNPIILIVTIPLNIYYYYNKKENLKSSNLFLIGVFILIIVISLYNSKSNYEHRGYQTYNKLQFRELVEVLNKTLPKVIISDDKTKITFDFAEYTKNQFIRTYMISTGSDLKVDGIDSNLEYIIKDMKIDDRQENCYLIQKADIDDLKIIEKYYLNNLRTLLFEIEFNYEQDCRL